MKSIISKPNQYGSISKYQLAHFEKENDIALPEDYRSFLLLNNGGHPIPSFFWIQPGVDGSSVQEFFGLHKGPKHSFLSTYINENHLVSPNSLLFIGSDGLGNYICLGMNSENYGGIFFIDHDSFHWGEADMLSGVSKISNSFSLFFDSLDVESEY